MIYVAYSHGRYSEMTAHAIKHFCLADVSFLEQIRHWEIMNPLADY